MRFRKFFCFVKIRGKLAAQLTSGGSADIILRRYLEAEIKRSSRFQDHDFVFLQLKKNKENKAEKTFSLKCCTMNKTICRIKSLKTG